eukprot:583600-Pelagomonas_calceolata.AAC.1
MVSLLGFQHPFPSFPQASGSWADRGERAVHRKLEQPSPRHMHKSKCTCRGLHGNEHSTTQAQTIKKEQLKTAMDGKTTWQLLPHSLAQEPAISQAKPTEASHQAHNKELEKSTPCFSHCQGSQLQ